MYRDTSSVDCAPRELTRACWKTMIVSKLMYGCGALALYQHECDDLKVIQNGFGRWLWEVGKVRYRMS